MKTYLTVYIGSMLLALGVTPIIAWVAVRFDIVDRPNVRKVHRKPIPRVGGVAIFIGMVALVLPVLLLPNDVGSAFRKWHFEVLVILAAGGMMFLLGLIDDVKGLRVRTKLLGQIAVALFICAAGIRIDRIVLGEWTTIHLGWLTWPCTIFWIVGITNAINLSDGLDGLAAGIAAVACAVIAVFAIYSGNRLMAVFMLALLGSLTGFLFFNFNPARIFMGDCGSLFLGTTIASASALSAYKTETVVGLALPVLALGIPIFDTFFTIVRRFLQRRPLFAPDSSHFHHRLLQLGLKQRHAVITAYAITAAAAGLGMFMLFTNNGQTFVIFFCTLLLFVMTFRAVGSVRFRETISGVRHNYNLFNHKKRDINGFQEAQLHFRQATEFDEWWQAACFAVDRMGFEKGLLPVQKRDGTMQVLSCENPPSGGNGHDDLVVATFPVRDRRSGRSLKMQVQVRANGSMESAGRRLALFSRLLDEHSIAALGNGSNGNGQKTHPTAETVT